MAKTKKKNKNWIIVVAVVLLISALVVPRFLRNKGNSYSEEVVKVGNIETYYTFSGNVESKNTQNVMAQKVMQISEVIFLEGDKIKKDEVLFITSQEEEIKSKIDGTLSKIYVQEDASVMAGANLCDIIDFDHLQITIKVDEYDLPSIEIGKEVSVTINALDKTLTGKISEISNTAINKNGVAYFTATLDLEEDAAVKVGMSAEAKILNESVKEVLIIPMSVLQFNELEQVYVLVKGDKGRPLEQVIKVGVNDGKNVEIIEGLTVDQIIMYQKTENSSTSGGFGGGGFPPGGRQ